MEPTPPMDYFKLLGISRDASPAELRSAYRKLALQVHPDRNPGDPQAEERFKQINEAYQVLSDPARRAAYLASGVPPATNSQQAWQAASQARPASSRVAPKTGTASSQVSAWLVAGVAFMAVLIGFVVFGFVMESAGYGSGGRAYPFIAPTDYPSPTPILTPTLTPTPIPVFDDSKPALALTKNRLTTGNTFVCALSEAGGARCWGSNDFGQLGDGTKMQRSTPVDVSGLEAGVAALAAGRQHTCALLESGAVKCWGDNQAGQLGDGTTTGSSRPVAVTGLERGVTAIAAGDLFTCALTSRGGVKCWGDDEQQQLGGPGWYPHSVGPVDVAGLAGGAVAIAAGGGHACALTGSGGVKCWGENGSGELGRDPLPTPGFAASSGVVDVPGLGGGAVAITAGYSHNCALTAAGSVKCWGDNYFGQLGTGPIRMSAAPIDVAGLSSGVAGIAAGTFHTCAWLKAGGLKCWGSDLGGRPVAPPADVTVLDEGVQAMALGEDYTCALTDSQQVKCWGSNNRGVLGDGDPNGGSVQPVGVSGLSAMIATPSPGPLTIVAPLALLPQPRSPLVMGDFWGCALTGKGGVQCWGDNSNGELGDGSLTNSPTAVNVDGLSSGVTAIAAGEWHACALLQDGTVKCWGANYSGELGNGTFVNSPTPVDVAGLAGPVVAIAARALQTCALLDSGVVTCWGRLINPQNHQRGMDNIYRLSAKPVQVTGLDHAGVVAIAVGDTQDCVLTDAGGVHCWGWDDAGLSFFSKDVVGLTGGVVAITSSTLNFCVLTSAGGVKCWGSYNDYGALGIGTTAPGPVSIPGDVFGLNSGVQAVSMGPTDTCALMNTGTLKCWGGNYYGELGDGSNSQSPSPVDVTALPDRAVAVAVANGAICALTESDQVKCWGPVGSGPFDDKTLKDSWIPAAVAGLDAVAMPSLPGPSAIQTPGAGPALTETPESAAGLTATPAAP